MRAAVRVEGKAVLLVLGDEQWSVRTRLSPGEAEELALILRSIPRAPRDGGADERLIGSLRASREPGTLEISVWQTHYLEPGEAELICQREFRACPNLHLDPYSGWICLPIGWSEAQELADALERAAQEAYACACAG